LNCKGTVAWILLAATCAIAQEADPRPPNTEELAQELRQTRAELAESRHQIEALRQSVEELRKQVFAGRPDQTAQSASGDSAAPSEATAPAEPTVAKADQDPAFLAAKVSEMHQSKVESASKYPVKLYGLVLFNSYWNKGVVDIQDLPNLALPSFPGAPLPGAGATLRQTLLGVDVSGPKVLGARTSAEAEVDFAGGSPTTAYGVTAGLLRLRRAKLALDWKNTSLSAGQDSLFFSPLSPTSYATVLEPAMSWSGNLWVWTPGVTLTHRVVANSSSSFLLQGGVLDALTEENPVFQGRNSTAGEIERVPAVAGRVAFEHKSDEGPAFTIGFGGYRARQQYGTFASVASWTLNSDIKLALGKHLELSGEFYHGQAVGGLGGGIWSSVVFPEPTAPHTAIQPLLSTGSWGQVKVLPTSRFEINGAFGQDENAGRDLRIFPLPFTSGGFPAMQKNRTEFVNVIFKPSSALIFAVEYRHLFTLPVGAPGHSADHVNVAAGVQF
jgi:hypothetical protein